MFPPPMGLAVVGPERFVLSIRSQDWDVELKFEAVLLLSILVTLWLAPQMSLPGFASYAFLQFCPFLCIFTVLLPLLRLLPLSSAVALVIAYKRLKNGSVTIWVAVILPSFLQVSYASLLCILSRFGFGSFRSLKFDLLFMFSQTLPLLCKWV